MKKYTILAILWMVLIFISSSIPSEDFPEVNWWGWSKIIHLIYFGVLCVLLRHVLQSQKSFALLSRYPTFFGVLFATCYGMTDEIHQIFTPGRHAMATDVLIDAFGACLFITGIKVIEFLKAKRTSAA